MKRVLVLLLIFALFLSACAQSQPKAASADQPVLKVTGADKEKTYTSQQLKSLGTDQASFKGVNYSGVQLSVLLKDAGYDPASIQAVKAVASDGFSANYDASLFSREDTLVSYSRVDEALAEDEGPFRMVLPDQEGKLNVRQLTEIQVIP
jgi:hypothetical protein